MKKKKLEEFEIENGVLKKYNGAGGDVIIPDGVETIDWNVFADCESLISVKIGQKVKTIGGCAFENCCQMKNIVIPSSVEKIEDYAFCGCNGLGSITIPASVTSIGGYVFDKCENLKSIVFEDAENWYCTDKYDDYVNKTGGELTNLSDAETNSDFFTQPYNGFNWYKIGL